MAILSSSATSGNSTAAVFPVVDADNLHDLRAERAVLGAMAVNRRAAFSDIDASGVTREHFSSEDHRLIFDAFSLIEENGEDPSDSVLGDALKEVGCRDVERVAAYAADLFLGCPESGSIRGDCRIVQQNYFRRQLRAACYSTLLGCDLGEDFEELSTSLASKLAPLQADPATPASHGWEDMPESVLDGRLGELWQQRLSRHCRALSYPPLVTAVGTLLPLGDYIIPPNIYCCAIGPPGCGKSVATRDAINLVGLTRPYLLDAQYGSAEGLTKDLAALDVRSTLLNPDEVAHLLAKSAIKGAALPYMLNSAFNNQEISGGTRAGTFSISCRIAVVGGIVDSQFDEAFGSGSTGGLYDRFAFGVCPSGYSYEYTPFTGSSIGDDLNLVRANVLPEIWEVRNEWIRKHKISHRVSEIALRFAYVAACADHRPLRAKDLGPALEMAHYQMRIRQSYQPNAGLTLDAKVCNQIRRCLEASGGSSSRTKLSHAVHSERCGSGVFNRCLKEMRENGELLITGKTIRLCREAPLLVGENG
jgi:hypothetical protein